MFYEREYNFKQAMDVLGPALNSVEPGIYEKIVDSYMRRKTPLS